MTGFLQTRNAEIHAHRHRSEAEAWRRGHESLQDESVSALGDALVIRFARDGDYSELQRLYELESRWPVPELAALVAEVDGEMVAALPLDGSAAVADPFRPTAQVVEMLRFRASQLDLGMSRPGGRVRRSWRALRRAAAAPEVAPATPGNAALLVRHDCE